MTQTATPTAPSLLSRLEQVFTGKFPEGKAPTGKPEEGQTVIGRLESPVLRSLFYFRASLIDELEALQPKERPKTLLGMAEYADKAAPLSEDIQMVSDLFWSLVKKEVPGANDTEYGIGLHENWDVVSLVQPRRHVMEIMIPMGPGMAGSSILDALRALSAAERPGK